MMPIERCRYLTNRDKTTQNAIRLFNPDRVRSGYYGLFVVFARLAATTLRTRRKTDDLAEVLVRHNASNIDFTEKYLRREDRLG
jgi:hypothetical protein